MTAVQTAVHSASARAARAGLAALIAITVTPWMARAQAIGYEITPALQHMRWSDALGLEDGFMWGGRVGLNFGPNVSLQPFFMTRSNLTADPTGIANGGLLTDLAARDFDARLLGADVQFNIGTADLVPFIRAGGGILRLDPEVGERVDQIAVKAGGGLRFGAGANLSGEVFAENMAFRLNRFNFYGAPSADPEVDDVRNNLVVGGGLSLRLGPADRDQFAWAAGGGGVPIEPFAGRLDFHDDLALDNQYHVGVRAGYEFNRMFGLRGFYWRGVTDDFDSTEPLSAYGGEAQFNLNAGLGLTPFLLAGAGRLDFRDEFEDPAGMARADRTMLILGGGVAIPLSDNLRVKLAARDYIMSETDELQDVATTDQLVHSWAWTAGLSFRIGRARPDPITVADAELRREIEQIRRERERLAELDPRYAMPAPPPPPRDADAALRREIRELVRDELRRAPVPREFDDRPLTRRDLELLEDRLLRRMEDRLDLRPRDVPVTPRVETDAIERRLDAIERRLIDRIDRIEQRVDTALTTQPRAQPIVPVDPAVSVTPVTPRRTLQEVHPYVGVNVTQEAQFVIGSRVDLGPITPGSPIGVVPELAFGFGEGSRTVLLAGNLQYDIAQIGTRNRLTPFVSGGAGIFSETIFALNFGYGAALDMRAGGTLLRGFIEHQGINVFDRNRILLGSRVTF